MSENNEQLRETRRNSFEPRLGTAQLVFGIIYGFIAGIGLVLAIYTWINSGHQHPWTQYFFVVLFLVLATKSFVIFARTRILYSTGRHVAGRVDSITAQKGLTVVTGYVPVNDTEEIMIESRYAGMSVAKELERFLTEQHTRKLPALVVGGGKQSPRGMFLIKTHAGHLDPQYLNSLKTDKN